MIKKQIIVKTTNTEQVIINCFNVEPLFFIEKIF